MSSVPEPRRLRAADADRDRVLDVLREAHGSGRLDLDEVDERTSAVLASRYLDELWPPVADLPEAAAVGDLAPAEARLPTVPDRRPVVASSEPRWGAAVMSGREVVLEPGSGGVSSVQFWGGDDYDLTQVMGTGVTVTITLYAVMAGSNIHVPPGVRIVDETINVMAGNSIEAAARGDGSQGTLRLAGFSFWAGHDVKLARPA